MGYRLAASGILLTTLGWVSQHNDYAKGAQRTRACGGEARVPRAALHITSSGMPGMSKNPEHRLYAYQLDHVTEMEYN